MGPSVMKEGDMRTSRIFFAAAVLFSVAFVSRASGEALKPLAVGNWTIAPYVGATAFTSQDMVESGSASATAAVTFSDGSTLSGTAAATINEVDFDDFYGVPFVVGADVGYMTTSQVEVFGGFRYTRADGDEFTDVGTVTAAFTFTDSSGTATTVSAGDVIQGSLEDYSSFSLNGGARYHFDMADPKFVPFVGASIGFLHVGEIDARVRLRDAGVSSGDIKYFDSTNTVTVGAQAGFQYQIAPRVSLGARLNADYQPQLNGNDSDLSLVNLGGVNDTGDGVTLGATARLTVRLN